MQFCRRFGWEDYIYRMLIVDFLILNRDRHGANIEILRNRKTGVIKPAPLFDHGISLLYNCKTEEDIDKADIIADKQVQCFVGSHSALANLELIPPDKRDIVRKLEERDRSYILADLDGILPDSHLQKIWEMIWARWQYYEDKYYSG